jgi:type IV secretion system protein VirB1
MIAAALLACAPNVAPATMQAIARVESSDNPLALNVNGLRVQPPAAKDARAAVRIAVHYMTRGYSVDLGLMQVNSRNLAALGITVAQALEPCTNIRAAAAILTADYAAAARRLGEGQLALRAALSAYNTGDFHRGFANGYIARYVRPGDVPARIGAGAPPPPPNPYTATTAVFVREATHVRIQ